MMNIYTTSITFLQAISMIKRGESRHAYLNNARDNKWGLSIRSTTSGKTKEKHQRKIYLFCVDHTERPKRPPSKSLDTYSYCRLDAFKQQCFWNRTGLLKAKLTGHIKMTWQDSERWLSGQNALWIAVSTGRTCKHDKCLIPWERVGKEKAIFWETQWRWHVNAWLFYYLLE